jgi:basic membrane protein A and related proteins
MDGTWKSANINGSLADDFLAIAPFGKAVSAEAAALVNAKKKDFIDGKANPLAGPIKDNKGEERVKEGQVFPAWEMYKMDWFAEGVIGQTH